MNNFQEVEKRIILTKEQRDRIFDDLKSIGGEYLKTQKIEDSYFCDKNCKSFAETAMKNVGSYGLRIRKKIDDDIASFQLNIKVITEDDNHHSWEEHEVRVDDEKEMSEILNALGQKMFFKFSKERHVFKYDNLEILIEDIEGFGPIVEVEGKTTFDQSEQMQEKIIETLKKLRLNPDNIVPKSVTFILMDKGSKF